MAISKLQDHGTPMNAINDQLIRARRMACCASSCWFTDDGKSTLIGECLRQQIVFSDQLRALEKPAIAPRDENAPGDAVRRLEGRAKQGITIDVDYRYIATPARNIVADAPGHEQYTRIR